MSSQGIVVSIQAKIEGWQAQIKEIQNAMKNLKFGSDLSKNLQKELSQVESLVNNLGKNISQRLTSDSQITSFTDKMKSVEEMFNNIGRSMSNVKFEDLNVEYITNNFKELLTQIEQAKTELSQGFESSFKEAIQGSERLQNLFSRLKIDPKNMNVDELKTALASTTETLTKELAEANKELDELYKKQQAIKQSSTEIQNSGLYKLNTKDIGQTLMYGAQGPQKEINHEAVEKYVNDMTSKLDTMGAKVQAKRAEIDEALKNILTADTVETVSERVDKLRTILEGTGELGTFNLTSKSIGKQKEDFIKNILPDEQSIKNISAMIKERLVSVFDITDADFLNKIGSTVENFIKNGKWDQLPDELEKICNEAQNRMSTTIANNEGLKKNIAEEINAQLSKVFTLGNRVGDANEANGIIQTIIETQVQAAIAPLEQRIAQLEQLLNLKGTEGMKNLGGNLSNKSTQGFHEATDAATKYKSALEDVSSREKLVGKLEGVVSRWFSIYAVVRAVSNAIRSMKENITALDKTITEIAIVTDMDQKTLWKQMPDYTAMARKYGSSIQGTYEVSQLYYQQGLQRDDVMALTEETLKMARISGLQYAEATNYMTNAIRSFKIEMQEASTVVDVYSALAASSASSTAELASAMSKTASSAAAVGSSFESTSAMLAVMIETTRESPENIGSALKSIISRYGELKENKVGIDEEGEEYSLNKVDKALQSVGISIHDAQGQFREFDDVIMELAESWDTIDTNTQRYIATIMAGNRQQSRFLALVSNGERLKELTDTAENSEDAATLQVLKTMDSIEYKSQQLQTSLQSMYTGSGIENAYKGLLDVANNIIETFGKMPTVFSLPIPALLSLGTTFMSVANVVMTGLYAIRTKFTAQREALMDDETSHYISNNAKEVASKAEAEVNKTNATSEGVNARKNLNNQEGNNDQTQKGWLTKNASKLALFGNIIGSGLQLISAQQSDRGDRSRAFKGITGVLGSTIQDTALGFQIGGPWGALAGGVVGLLTGAINNIQYFIQSTEERAKRLKQEAEEDSVKAKTTEAAAKNQEKTIADLEKLAAKRHESAEAEKEWIEASNQAAENMPELIDHFDNEGNAILNLSNAYEVLKKAREESNESAQNAAISAGRAAYAATKDAEEKYHQAVTLKMGQNIDINRDLVLSTGLTDPYSVSGEFTLSSLANLFNSDISSVNNLLNSFSPDSERNDPLQDLLILLREKNYDTIYALLENDYDNITEEWETSIQAMEESEVDSNELSVIKAIVENVINKFSEIKKLEGDYLKSQANESSMATREISNIVSGKLRENKNKAYYNNDSEAQMIQDRIDNLDNASSMITSYIVSKYNDSIKGITDENIKNQKWESLINSIGDGSDSDPLKEMYEILKTIPENNLEEINALYNKQGQLTKSQFKSELQKLIPNQTNEFYESLMKYYETAFQDWNLTLEDFKKSDYQLLPNIKKYALLGDQEQRRILNNYESLNKMLRSGAITSTQGQNLSTFYSQLINKTFKAGEAAGEIYQSIFTTMDFSQEGIQKAIDEINSNKDLKSTSTMFIPLLEQMLAQLPININTAIESYINSTSEAIENYSKDISNATKGMDIKAAGELAKKLGINTSEKYFDIKDGTLFLKDVELLNDYYFGEDGILSNLSTRMQNMHTVLSSKEFDPNQWVSGQSFSKDGVEISAKEMSSIINAWKGSGIEDWDEFLTEYFVNQIQDIKQLPDKLKASIDLKNAIDSGKLEDIVKAAGTDTADQVSWAITEELQRALKTGDFSNLLANGDLSDEFKNKLPELQQAYNQANKSVIESLTNSLEQGVQYITQTDFNKELLTALESAGLASKFSETSDGIVQWVINNTNSSIDSIIAFLESDVGIEFVGGKKNARKYVASLHKTQFEASADGIIQNIVNNYESISEETAKALEDLGLGVILTDNGKGNFKIDVDNLYQLFKSNEITGATTALIDELIATIADSYLEGITNAASYIIKGTTKTTDMQKFVNQYNKQLDSDLTISALFEWNDILDAFTLKPEYLSNWLQKQKEELVRIGFSADEVDKYLESQLISSTASAVDISSFLKSEERTGKSRKTLESSLTNFKNAVAKQSQDYSDYYDQAINEYYQQTGFTEHDIDRESVKGIGSVKDRAQKLVQKAKEFNDKWHEIQEKEVDDLIAIFEEGGDEAVKYGQLIAEGEGKTLSAEEISELYKAKATKYISAMDKLGSLQVGDFIDAQTIEMLGSTITQEGGRITYINDLVQAYKNLYTGLKESLQATTAELNGAYAKVLTASEQREIDAIDALQNAMGMTYDALGEMLAKYNISLETAMMNPQAMGISQIGGGKVRIDNFKAFASTLGLKGDSEEYTSAFKAYNDSLIQLNQNAKEKIYNELNAITSAKAGDWINLTELANHLEQIGTQYVIDSVKRIPEDITQVTGTKTMTPRATSNALKDLNAKIGKYGGQIVDGILKLYDGIETNIAAILQEIMQYDVGLGEEQKAQLQDAINGLMNNITNLISSGIKGSLSSVDAFNLQTWGLQQGLKSLDFVTTAEGLKLTSSSLMAVYNKLNQINSFSARKLLPDMATMSDKYDTLSEVLDILEQSADSAAKSLAKNLAEYYLDQASTYKDYWKQNPLTFGEQAGMDFYSSYAQGRKVFTGAMQKGKMGYEDALYMARFAYTGQDQEKLLSSIRGNSYYDEKSGQWFVNMNKLTKTAKEWLAAYEKQTEEMRVAAEKRQQAQLDLEKAGQDASKKDSDWWKNFLGDKKAAEKGVNKSIQDVMKNIKINDVDTLWDSFISEGGIKNTNFWQKFFDTLATGDWSQENMQEMLMNALGVSVLEWDVNGKFKVHIDENGVQVVDASDSELKGKALENWILSTLNSSTDDTEIVITGSNNVKYRFVLKDGNLEVVDENGNKIDPTSNELPQEVKDVLKQFESDKEYNAGVLQLKTRAIIDADIEGDLDDGGKIKVTLQGGEEVEFDKTQFASLPEELQKMISEALANKEASTVKLTGDNEDVKSKINEIKELVKEPLIIKTGIEDNITTAIKTIKQQIEQNTQIKLKATIESPTEGAGGATGNVSLAQGNALSNGTLVGELGPELVVSNGRYFVVGQNGAEMINLPKDAIVFNHIQTQQLLANGRAGRGKPITNERNAAGMAHATGSKDKDVSYWRGVVSKLTKEYRDAKGWHAQATTPQAVKDAAARMQKIYAALTSAQAKLTEATKAVKESTSETKKKTKEDKKKSTTKTTARSSKLHDAYGTVRHSSTKTSSTGTSGSSSPNGGGGGGDNTFGRSASEVVRGSSTSTVGTKTGELTDKQKKAISSAISEVISKGFESIDLDSDAFKEVPANIKEEMKKFIADPNASYAKFLEKYKEYLDISVHEFNEQYFAALQKDLENEGTAESILSAAEGLTFFAGGAVAGSSSDWVTLFGDYTDVQKLVQDEILKWDANLKKYVITDIEALKKYGTNLDIDAFEAIREDSIRTSTNQMADWLVSGLEGSLSSVDFKQLQSYIKEIGASMIGDNGFSKTGSGIKITAAAAAKLYAELCKIDSVAANITLKKLDESLSKTNEDYKTTSSLLAHIKDLQNKIAKASKYDTTKINQYKEELALAQQIAAIRATSEDQSMNFLDQAIPGGFNNPLNYIQNLITGWKTLNEAATKGGAMDFKTLYNLAREINNEAAASGQSLNLLGQTLDGTATSLAQFAQTMATALGTDSDGNFGVVLSKLGIDLTKGASDYAGSADTALKTMAKSQIEILDGLIAFFEAIVAMEKFEKADIDKNGLLDLSEIFQLDKNKKVTKEFTSTFKKIAQDILATAGKNSDLSQALKSIKFDGISLEDLLKDATNGKFNIKGISQDTYQKIMSLVYEAYKKGDYNLDNIADSVLSVISANESGYKGTIDLGTMIIDVESKTKITKTSSGKWQYTDEDGKTHETDDSEEALRRTVLGNLGAKKIKWSEKTKTATGELTIAGKEVKVKSGSEGTIYTWKGNTYKSLDELYKAMYDVSGSDLSFEDWKVSVGITVTTKMSTDTSGIDPSKVLPLVGKAWEDVLAEYEKNPEEFKIKYGFEPDKTKTASDWAEWLKTIGIEDKVYKLSMYIEKLDFSEDAWTTIQKLISGEAYTKVVPNSGAGAGKPKKNGAKDIDSSEETPYVPTVKPQTGDTGSGGGSGGSGSSSSVDTKKLEAYKALLKEVQSIVTELSTAKIAVEADKKDVKDLNKLLKSVDEYTTKLANVLITVNTNGASGLQEIVELLEALNTKLDNIKDKANVSIAVSASEGGSSAKGNVALAAGRTLMGELGPELVVSNGRYFTVGNNGAEFVNLPKDAIVFNHLQTQQLLSNGHASRGTPVVSEVAAVSMAAGNALASASETLATLKALRAMWQALADSSIQDLVKTASAGSDSGGGGNQEQIGAWLKSVERWYNWLQKIAAIEKEINKEEAFRSKLESDRVKDGEAYFSSQARQLAFLQDKANTQADLAREYAERFEFRKRELNSENSPMSQFYRYNDYGQLYYVPGGFEKLQAIMRQDDQGHTITPKEQYDLMLKTYGLGEYMKYDSEGKELTVKDGDYDTYYREAVQAAWDRMEAERDEMQSLYDSSNEMQQKYLESITAANKILQEIADNQMSVENSILEAIESQRQEAIDKLTDEREALSDSVNSYIKGLRNSLENERKLYNNETSGDEIIQLQRQIAILRRSGGSATQIAGLEKDLNSKQREAYFTKQEEAIKAIEDSSNAELEKLQTQIDLMTETLNYEKDHGLLWNEVAEIMRGDAESIADFVTGNDKTWVAKSPLAKSEELQKALFEAEQWTSYRDNTNSIFSSMTQSMTNGFSSVVTPLAETKAVLDKVEESIRTTGQNIIDKLYTLSPRVESSDPGTTPTYIPPSDTPETPLMPGKEKTNYKGAASLEVRFTIKGKEMVGLITTDTYEASTKKDLNKTIREEIRNRIKDIAATEGYDDGSLRYLKDGKEVKYTSWNDDIKDAIQYQYFSRGGEVNYTGPAVVHGTPNNPEYMLNADEYRTWKHHIVGDNNSSLMSRLEEFNDLLGDLEKTRAEMDELRRQSYKNDLSGISIEHAEVSMHIDKIADDYDAQRAGEQALNKMLEIARKSAGNRIGR